MLRLVIDILDPLDPWNEIGDNKISALILTWHLIPEI